MLNRFNSDLGSDFAHWSSSVLAALFQKLMILIIFSFIEAGLVHKGFLFSDHVSRKIADGVTLIVEFFLDLFGRLTDVLGARSDGFYNLISRFRFLITAANFR